jgi:carbon storage regulator
MNRLVLSRKPGQRIFIGDDIILTIVRVSGLDHNVKVAIEAPRDTLILREEIAVRRETDRDAMVRQVLDEGMIAATRHQLDAMENR